MTNVTLALFFVLAPLVARQQLLELRGHSSTLCQFCYKQQQTRINQVCPIQLSEKVAPQAVESKSVLVAGIVFTLKAYSQCTDTWVIAKDV